MSKTIDLNNEDKSKLIGSGFSDYKVFMEAKVIGLNDQRQLRYWVRAKDLSQDYGPFDSASKADTWASCASRSLKYGNGFPWGRVSSGS